MAFIVRFVDENRAHKVVSVQQRPIHVSFVGGPLSAVNMCSETSNNMIEMQLMHLDVLAFISDGCSVNEAAHTSILREHMSLLDACNVPLSLC